MYPKVGVLCCFLNALWKNIRVLVRDGKWVLESRTEVKYCYLVPVLVSQYFMLATHLWKKERKCVWFESQKRKNIWCNFLSRIVLSVEDWLKLNRFTSNGLVMAEMGLLLRYSLRRSRGRNKLKFFLCWHQNNMWPRKLCHFQTLFYW